MLLRAARDSQASTAGVNMNLYEDEACACILPLHGWVRHGTVSPNICVCVCEFNLLLSLPFARRDSRKTWAGTPMTRQGWQRWKDN